jgi:hypothetical protein
VSSSDELTVDREQISRSDDPKMVSSADDGTPWNFLAFALSDDDEQEGTDMSTDRTVVERGTALRRIAPLAGVLFAGLAIAGDLTIGPFPDGSTPIADLQAYYRANGGHVSLGGTLMTLGGVCFVIFAAAVWARLRSARVPVLVSGVVLLGAAIDAMNELNGGSIYHLLGHLGRDSAVTGPALQAWHIHGSEFGVDGGAALFLLGLAAAGIAYRAVPRWLAWTGLVLAIALLVPSPFGFLASMLVLVWAAAAGIALTVRPEPAAVRVREVAELIG